MNIFSITATFARCDQRVGLGIFFIKAHITNWGVGVFGSHGCPLNASFHRLVVRILSIGFSQIQKTPTTRSSILHNFLNFFLTKNSVFLAIVGLNYNNTNRTNTQKIPYLQGVGCRRVLSISKQTACSRVTREGFWRRHNPKRLPMCSHQQLARTGIRKLVTLQFSSNVASVVGTKVGARPVAVAVGSLNDNTLRPDIEGSEFFLAVVLAVVTWVDTNFHLCVQAVVDLRSGVETANRRCRNHVL
mmetsp:Transcript_24876/g.42328  ORF Transcript_24876/g.42328 Transcript_24876/m.42328 type:complete len:245 (-) Transcript_24876:183-917(-)